MGFKENLREELKFQDIKQKELSEKTGSQWTVLHKGHGKIHDAGIHPRFKCFVNAGIPEF